MKVLVDIALSRSRMIVAFLILSLAAGLNAFLNLPKEAQPSIDIPFIYVSVSYPGVSALDAERLLVKPLETELKSLEGLKEISANATEGHAGVSLEFDFGFDKEAILAEVREEVAAAKVKFPVGAEEPQIIEINTSNFPILVVTLSGDVPERTLLRFANQLQDVVEGVSGVLEAEMNGQREELLELLLDRGKMEALNLGAQEILASVTNNNRVVAAGQVRSATGEFSLKLPGSVETLDDLYALPLKVRGDRVVTLGDVSTLRRTFDDRQSYARFNGKPTIALQVKKRPGENIIDTVNSVKVALDAELASWPASLRQVVNVDYSLDQSRQVEDMVSQLENSVITAIVLVMIVVVGALGLRSALLVGAAIPASFMLAFALMGVLGMTISNMVLFGLILAVGMLVDSAIVIVEYADQRLKDGARIVDAYGEAAKRMFWPIISSTATTLCAFLPMLFWPGMSGEFMRYLPITLIFVLTASLLVALIYLPVMGTISGRILRWWRQGLAAVLGSFGLTRRGGTDAQVQRAGRSALRPVLRLMIGNPVMPFVLIACVLALMAGIFNRYQQNNYGVDFFVDQDPEFAMIFVSARGNLSIEQKNEALLRVEEKILDIPELKAVFAIAGGGSAGGSMEAQPPVDAVGSIQIELVDWQERGSGKAVLDEIRRRTADMPGIRVEIAELADGPRQGKPIQVEVAGRDFDQIMQVTRKLRTYMDQMSGLVDVDDTLPLPGIEWLVKVDRTEAGKFGANIDTIGGMLQLVTRGLYIDSYRPDDADDEIEIRARFPDAERSLETLDTMRISTASGLVPLGNFVTREARPRLSSITRRAGERYLLVRADVGPGANANAKIAEIKAWLKTQDLGQGITTSFRGDLEEQAEAQAFLMQAFIGALGLMFIILLAQFNSLYNAILVLSAVVMSVFGVFLGMMVMGQPFSVIMTGVGIVALAGIVVNNNIVLIDMYQELAEQMDPVEAIIDTVRQRIRPVLLTTITTIAGLMPMMLALSLDIIGRQVSTSAPSSLFWVQLATAIVFGLGFATVLTLVMTPCLLALRVWIVRGGRWIPRRTGEWMRRRREAWAARRAARAVEKAAVPDIDEAVPVLDDALAAPAHLGSAKGHAAE